MGKRYWSKFFFQDLDRDCRALSLAARGAWVWIFGDLENYHGARTLSLEKWSRVISASIPQTISVLDEIIESGVCDSNVPSVSKALVNNASSQKNNVEITLICRRIVREAKRRNSNNIRQKRFQEKQRNNAANNGEVTGQMLDAKMLDARPPLTPPDAAPENNGGDGHRGLSAGDLFLILWESYPAHRRTKKTECLSEFVKLRPDRSLLDRVLAALDQLKTTDEWTRESGRYVPGLLKWITDRGWEAVKAEIQCTTCNRTGIVVRDGPHILPWTLERECKQGLKPDVCPDCRGQNRISVPGTPNLRFPCEA